MSLELAAQHLASRGRKGDSMLVHMAPEEVSGLQALARAGGGTLTLNPDTGLPEANFLKRMLPMLIGAGITAATGGAAAPWMIGLGMGGVETLRTGDLSKGLMAGLGAYGGAGVAGGLLGAGAGAAQQAAVTGAGQGASQAAMNQAARVATDQAIASPLSTMGAGIKSLGGEAGRSAALSSMGGGAQAAKYGLAALGPAMMQDQAQTPFAGSGPNPYEFDYDPNNQRYTRVPVGTRQRDILAPTTPITAMPIPITPTTPMQYAADGGMMDSGPIEDMSDRNQMETMMANGGQRFAAGGPSHLGDYSDGGRLLKGPGNGTSDDIPATIADKRPARLADGEFVIPSRIVSELGNGSTEAGARQLYAMMDRVQKARAKTTGKNKVAFDAKARNLLPA